jgi:hypothetical protein
LSESVFSSGEGGFEGGFGSRICVFVVVSHTIPHGYFVFDTHDKMIVYFIEASKQ